MSEQGVTEPLEEYAARIAHALNLAERGLNEEMKISDRLRTELAAEKEARENAEAMVAAGRESHFSILNEEKAKLSAKLEAAKEALRWYRSMVGNMQGLNRVGDERLLLYKDKGRRADKALATLGGDT